jgi:hypothetical protein
MDADHILALLCAHLIANAERVSVPVLPQVPEEIRTWLSTFVARNAGADAALRQAMERNKFDSLIKPR